MNQQSIHVVLKSLPYLPEASKLLNGIETCTVVEQT